SRAMLVSARSSSSSGAFAHHSARRWLRISASSPRRIRYWTRASRSGPLTTGALVLTGAVAFMSNRLDVLHFLGDLVEGGVAIDLFRQRLEEGLLVRRVGRHDRRRGHHPDAHPLAAPGIGVAGVDEGHFRIRRMDAAHM